MDPQKRIKEKITKTARGLAIFRATVKDGKGGVATATKLGRICSFPDFLEKSETSSVDRALAELGYSTQFSGSEFEESKRIVDTPQQRAS